METELEHLLEPLAQADEMGATVYFILQSNDQLSLKRADIEDHAQPQIRDLFVTSIQHQILDNEELSVIALSSADDRANAIYLYDLDEIPDGLQMIDRVLQDDDLLEFSFTSDQLSDLKGLIILIGNNEYQLAIYKKFYPINLFKRDRFMFIPTDTRFEKIDQDVFTIGESIDFFKVNGKLYIMNLTTLERFFGFHDIIQRKAIQGLQAVEDSNILENPEELETQLSEISFARKLVKVTKDSPVLADNIPTSEVIEFTKTHPGLEGKFQYNQDESRIQLDTKKSMQVFLKLLNDDFLNSELTRRIYESIAKDEIAST